MPSHLGQMGQGVHPGLSRPNQILTEQQQQLVQQQQYLRQHAAMRVCHLYEVSHILAMAWVFLKQEKTLPDAALRTKNRLMEGCA